jgi:hypothetical protein
MSNLPYELVIPNSQRRKSNTAKKLGENDGFESAPIGDRENLEIDKY